MLPSQPPTRARVATQQPQIVDVTYAHPKRDPSSDRATLFRTRNVVCMPLVSWSDGRLLGVLQLLNKHEGAVSAWEREMVGGFGDFWINR